MGGQILEYEAKTLLNRGRVEGMEKGIQQGREQANIESAQKMLLGNMEVSLIMEITNLPKEKVEALRQEMKQKGELKEE